MLKIKNLKILLFFLAISTVVYAQEPNLSGLISEEYGYFPSCQIKIKPPSHFVLSPKFNGYYHSGSGSSIVITFTKSQKSSSLYSLFSDAALAEKNVRVISRVTDTLSNNSIAYLITARTSLMSNDTTSEVSEFERLIFFTDTPDGAVCINANYPSSLSGLLYKVIHDSFLTSEPFVVYEKK